MVTQGGRAECRYDLDRPDQWSVHPVDLDVGPDLNVVALELVDVLGTAGAEANLDILFGHLVLLPVVGVGCCLWYVIDFNCETQPRKGYARSAVEVVDLET